MRVDSRELRRCVVRLDTLDGRALGTGFFVAPGYVVTCAHVVFDADRVHVVPADLAFPASHGSVVARSASPLTRTWRLWPFPDLALVQTDATATSPPCVLLDTRDPTDECHAWGYAEREKGVDPTGSPASFTFEGPEGDGYLKLKSGQAGPGLSGAPLVCPGRRAAVGVVAASRGTATDLGGYASPVSALLRGGPGVPAELVAYAEEIGRRNRQAILADRQAWHRVFPVETDGLLEQPWAVFERRPKSSPADLLRADYGVVPYLFREEHLASAVRWCESASPMAVSRVGAPGGAGKTRFAIELCKRMTERGWLAGFWESGAAIEAVPLPRLVVADYVETADARALRDALDGLRRHATDIAPVRVLLLTRAGAARNSDPLQAVRDLAPATLLSILDGTEDAAAAGQLTDVEARTLYAAATTRMAAAWLLDCL